MLFQLPVFLGDHRLFLEEREYLDKTMSPAEVK
jgi:hypothetical protein